MKWQQMLVVFGMIWLVVLLVGLVGGCAEAMPTFDSPLPPPEPGPGPGPVTAPPLTDVLGKLAQGIGIGAVVAFLFEKLKWFQGLTSEQRWWLILGLSVGLPVIAQVLLQFVPAEVWDAIEPFWQSLALGFLTWVGSQVAHRYVNKRP